MKRRLKAGKRRNSGFSLNVLTDDECNEIHLATLDVLKHTGVFVEHKEALDVLDGGRCIVDRKNKVVKFPHWVVEDAIRMAPSTFYAYGRRPQDDVVLEDNRVTFTNFGEGIMFVDPYTGEHRDTTKQDIVKAARIIDSLEHIETYERAMCSHDKPPEVQAIHNAEASLTNTTKHHWLGPVNGYQADKVIDICTAIVGSQEEFRKRPLLSFASCPISPLKLPEHHSEIVMKAAENGMGMLVIGMAMAGGSSPVHLAGTLVIQNCEILSTLVLNQLTRNGSQFVYGTSTCPMDLRMATATVGSPETGMISAAVARLARYYSLPSFVAGGQGDSKVVDAQSGHEKTITGLLPALAGANVIYGSGMLEMGITFDLAQLVMDHEIAEMILHSVQGIPVSDETLSVDIIKEMGIGKDYLAHESTYKYMKSQSQAKLIDRRMREDWEAVGSPDIYKRAHDKVLEILESYEPPPLSDDVLATIRSIIEEAEKELGVFTKTDD